MLQNILINILTLLASIKNAFTFFASDKRFILITNNTVINLIAENTN
jgi:hypothetical protein